MKRSLPYLALLLGLPLLSNPAKSIWIDPEVAASENPDFTVQGEYFKEGASHAVQVVAHGNGKFEAYVLEGGLPGAGWEVDKSRIRMEGARNEESVQLADKESGIQATIHDGKLTLVLPEQQPLILPRIERQSPTLGAKAPKGAVVLFDGISSDTWKNGLLENGLLKANHSMSKQTFKSYTAHIEFRTPFKPDARGQKRGNSGVYHYGRWETQILDSFGLEGKDNECGGIYSISKPRMNMCLPPLSWQSYDVDFTAATFDAEGKHIAWPRITVKLNGVLIHEDLELNKDFTTAAPLNTPLKDEPGPIFLQEHKNPVYFRNIWVLPR